MGIIYTALVGLLVGYVARAVLPGKDSIGMLPTAGLGIVAGLIGGAVGLGGDSGRAILGMPIAGFLWAVLLAVVLLLAYRMFLNTKK